MTVLLCITEVFLLWILADFVTGMIHWWQDAYGNPTWPIVGKYIIQPNLRHHSNPRAMVKVSYWSRMNTSITTAILMIGVCLLFGVHSWKMFVFFAFASQGNEIHAIGHRTDKENGRIVMWFQKVGIFQRRRTHGWHHKAPYDTNFFVMTEFLNPVFNKIKFFERLEMCIQKVLHIKPLRGSATRGGV